MNMQLLRYHIFYNRDASLYRLHQSEYDEMELDTGFVLWLLDNCDRLPFDEKETIATSLYNFNEPCSIYFRFRARKAEIYDWYREYLETLIAV